MHHETGRDLGAQGEQTELERRDDAQVAASTSEPPEQVRFLGGAGSHETTVGGHDVRGEQVVDGQPVLPADPTKASPEGEAGDASH